ncbi:MAG: hypothetical protein WA823_11630 [Candidatus Acidiferrales bacterium]
MKAKKATSKSKKHISAAKKLPSVKPLAVNVYLTIDGIKGESLR